jgi:Integral membrane protein, interacts with FtsH
MGNNGKYSARQIAVETQRYITKVYLWMSLALIISGGVAVWTAASPDFIALLMGNKYVFMGLLISEFLLVAFLVGWVKHMSPEVASLVFLGYSALNGFTFSVIFLTFTMSSIATTFFITAGTFAVMSIYGYFTHTDLTRWGNLLIMALFGLVIASFINLLYKSEILDWITTFAGIFIFVGLIAYDTQKIKQMNIIGNEGSDDDKREAIIGALTLYLDFINLFLKLLRLFGRRK